MNWEAFRGKRVFLTGGSGFIGKWLIKRFIEKNQELSLDAHLDVLVRPESSSRMLSELRTLSPLSGTGCLHIVHGECGSFQMLYPADYFIHAAVPRGDMREWTETHYEQAIGDMAHVLGQAKKAGVKRFLFLSSGLTNNTDIQFGDPRYLYYITKQSQEALLGYFRNDTIQCHTARIYSVLGYGMDPHYAAYQFIQSALNKKEISIECTVSAKRSYVYIEDLVDQLWAILPSEESGIWDLLSEEPILISSLAYRIAEYFKVPCRVTTTNGLSEPYDLDECPDFDPTTSLTDAIAKTCAMYQRHHDQSLR